MAGGHHHEVEAAARQLREAVNALPVGPQKRAMRQASEAMIAALLTANYTLRNGHELPLVDDGAAA